VHRQKLKVVARLRNKVPQMMSIRLLFAFAAVVTAFDLKDHAGAMDRAELKDVPASIRQWFESMMSPSGKPCCSYADGHRTGYEIRGHTYWVQIDAVWTSVPREAVIFDKGNPFAEAVVWYSPAIEGGKWTGRWKIICFVPGSGA
jgi:hypothetical protein